MSKNKTKVQISRQAYLSIIGEEKKGVFIHVKMRTEPSNFLKTSKVDGTNNPYFKQVKKVTERNFRLLPDYEQRVRTWREKEGHQNPDAFVTENAKGKVRVKNAIFEGEKDSSVKYIMLESFQKIKSKVRFEFQGNSIEKAILERWFSDRENSSQKQELQIPVNVLTPKLENIFQVSYKGIVYELID
jgi:hypothetical protein